MILLSRDTKVCTPGKVGVKWVSNTEQADQRGLRVRKNTFPLSCDIRFLPSKGHGFPATTGLGWVAMPWLSPTAAETTRFSYRRRNFRQTLKRRQAATRSTTRLQAYVTINERREVAETCDRWMVLHTYVGGRTKKWSLLLDASGTHRGLLYVIFSLLCHPFFVGSKPECLTHVQHSVLLRSLFR